MINLIRKTSIAIVALGGIIGSAAVYAQTCVNAPECPDLGYTWKTADCASGGYKALKCPINQEYAFCIATSKVSLGEVTAYGGKTAVVSLIHGDTGDSQIFDVLIGVGRTQEALKFNIKPEGTPPSKICDCPTGYSLPKADTDFAPLTMSIGTVRDGLTKAFSNEHPQGCSDAGTCPLYISDLTTLYASGGKAYADSAYDVNWGNDRASGLLSSTRCLCIKDRIKRPY